MSFVEIVNLTHTIVGVAFFIGTGILALLTYKNARKTLLNPMKSEVVKQQTDLFIELLSFLKQLKNDEDTIYDQTLYINIFGTLSKAGLIPKEAMASVEEIEGLGGIYFPTLGPNQFNFEVITEVYVPSEKVSEPISEEKTLYDIIEAGEFQVERLGFPKIYDVNCEQLNEYIRNPLLPTPIINLLKEIDRSISDNIAGAAKKAVKEIIDDAPSHRSHRLQMTAISNTFNKYAVRVDGRCSDPEKVFYDPDTDVYSKIRKEIRTYLHIDDDWI